MPFVGGPTEVVESQPKTKAKNPEDELPKEVVDLQRELEQARREISRQKAEIGNPAENVSVQLLQFDPGKDKTALEKGLLFYLQDGERINIKDSTMATNFRTIRKREAGSKALKFVILLPPGRPLTSEEERQYTGWFPGVEYVDYSRTATP